MLIFVFHAKMGMDLIKIDFEMRKGGNIKPLHGKQRKCPVVKYCGAVVHHR